MSILAHDEMSDLSHDPNVRTLTLPNGRIVLFDATDELLVRRHRWSGGTASNMYPRTRIGKQVIRMHRLLLNFPEGVEVDHINGNKLDNRRANLRLCSRAENSYNTSSRDSSSQYKGVCWAKHAHRWVGKIFHDGKRIHLGYFDSEVDAARAYNVAALHYFGKFARLNVIDDMKDEAA